MHGIYTFKRDDPNFRIRIISQRSKQGMSVQDNLNHRRPDLKIKVLTWAESGITKTQFCEYVKKTLKERIISIFSLLIESGMDITIHKTNNRPICAVKATHRWRL